MDRIIEDKRRIKPKHWKYILLGVFTIAVMGFLTFRDTSTTFKVDKEKVSIGEVFEGDFIDYIRIIGQVEPITTIYLDLEEGGKVEEILIEEGEMVKKGDVILRLRNNDLNLSIMNSESQLAYHTNELRNTMIQMEQQKIQNRSQLLRIDYDIIKKNRKYKQNKALFKDELISREEFLIAKENYEMAMKNRELTYQKLVQDSIFRENQKERMNENLENMQRNLMMVRKRIENLNVKAPIDGQLGLLKAEIGESINRGQRIGQVNVLTSYKITALIDEHYIDRIKRGLNGNFERQGDKFKIAVTKVYPEVREGQFEIDLQFSGQMPNNMRTGQTYYINLQLGETQKAKQIERGGFFQSTGGQWVYVLSPDETFAIKRDIKIGKQNPQYYEVLEGLASGEKVITSNYDVFGDNDKLLFE